MKDHPIGIFDSGVGGLSVFREIRKTLPDESIIYFADSANCPYGSKDRDETLELAQRRISFLLAQGCKLIVIACNTVTAVAIDHFRQSHPIPFIGMEPALKPAAGLTRTGRVGVLATENTFNGRLFQQTRETYAGNVEVMVQPGFGLAELVEKGAHDSDEAAALLNQYLVPMMDRDADTLVLGCSHYPFLADTIRRVTQNRMQVVDPSEAVAAQTKRVLEENRLEAGGTAPEFVFYTTGRKTTAENFLVQTMGDQPFRMQRAQV